VTVVLSLLASGHAMTGHVVDNDKDDLEILVERFSKALLAKLRTSRAKGRAGWDCDDWESECQQGLIAHLGKGDPIDVAAYCAFMWHHGWITVGPKYSEADVRGIRAAYDQMNDAFIAANDEIAAANLIIERQNSIIEAFKQASPEVQHLPRDGSAWPCNVRSPDAHP